MKTLFISYNGAAEPLMQSQGIPYLRVLSAEGVGVTLLSFEKARKKNTSVNIDILKRDLADRGIEWYRLRYHKRPTFPATLFDILQGIFFGIFIILKEDINIIHARSTVPAAIGYALSKILRKKFIFDERGLMAEEYVDGGMWNKNSVVYKLTLYFEKKFLKNADGVVVLSDNIRVFLKDSFYIKNWNVHKKDRMTVIPSCVDMNRFRPIYNLDLRQRCGLQDKFVFLYSGSLGTWYLVEEMLEFFTCAKEAIPNAHFYFLVHEGRHIVEAACIRKRLSLSDVTITSVTPMDMPAYISMADAGIFFIKPCFSKRSSCPTKFAEYLSCGLPVLINKGIGDTAEVVERNKIGFVVGNFTKEEYAEGASLILKYSNDGDVKKRCVETAERLFSLERGAHLYLGLYNKVFQKTEL
ncbi:MAG: glycosyltransferase family 4 protein [Candidatus Omnitrophota bacterium]|nr:glycosyltransferase family 4 protein [Candidatus Omnitrophota bacterium]